MHQRLRKGLGILNRRLVGGVSLGALLVPPLHGQVVLDAVAPQVVSAAREAVNSYFSASAAATTAASAQTALTETLAAKGATAGGVVMQAKTVVGAFVLAISCLVGGAALSQQLLASGLADEHDAAVAELRGQLESDREDLASMRSKLDDERSRSAAKIGGLGADLELLRGQLDERDLAIAALDARVEELTSGSQAASRDGEVSRDERWEEIQEMYAGVMGILVRMQEAGANQYELGPILVAELGKMTREQFDAIMAFDAAETDPEVVAEIRAVMMQAFTFVESTAPLKNDYMERYIERARNGGYGAGFTNNALGQLTFAMPPFFDAYKKLVEPLNPDLQNEYVEMAVGRVAAGNSDVQRLDGARFLARSPDARAAPELMRIVRDKSNTQQLRLTAVKGLASRADETVLQYLRDAESTEQDEKVLAELTTAAGQVERLVAREE